MRKWFKRISVVLATLCFCGVLFSCQKWEDVLPKSYGEWDGNYLYHGNGKCKTTGEDFERLVESVEIGEKTYAVIGCVDSEWKGDDIYMVLVVGEEETDSRTLMSFDAVFDQNYACVLVRYTVGTGECALLFDEGRVATNEQEESLRYRTTTVLGIYADRIVLEGYAYSTEETVDKWRSRRCYYSIGFDGSFFGEVETSLSLQRVRDECFVGAIYDKGLKGFEYQKGNFGEPKKILFEETEGYFRWSYIEQAGVYGIRIEERKSETVGAITKDKLMNLRFFDLETERMSQVLTVDKFADFYGDGGIVHTYFYEMEEYYVQGLEKRAVNVEVQNEISRIVYGEELRLERITDLKEKKNHSIYAAMPDVIAYAETSWMNAFGCVRQIRQNKYYEYNVQTGKKKEIWEKRLRALEEKDEGYYERKYGKMIGEYVYYISEEPIYGSEEAYLLHRYHTATGKTEVMQIWREYEREMDGARYCRELWIVWDNHPEPETYKEFAVYTA